jgi:hypothetical protein
MPFLYFALTFCFAIPAGFLAFSRGAIFRRTSGQILVGLFTVPCFGFIGWAFWHFGWKAGIAEVIIIFSGANVGQTILEYLANRSRR